MRTGYNFLQLYWVLRNRSHQVRKFKSSKDLQSLLFDISLDPENSRSRAEAVSIAIILDENHEIIDSFYKDLKRSPTTEFDCNSLKNIVRYACQDYQSLIFEMNALLNSRSFLNGALRGRDNGEEN